MHLLLRTYESVRHVAWGDSGCDTEGVPLGKHRPMRICSEQVLNRYNNVQICA